MKDPSPAASTAVLIMRSAIPVLRTCERIESAVGAVYEAVNELVPNCRGGL
jgi:hypothetical protein